MNVPQSPVPAALPITVTVRNAIKRGAYIVAANWQVVLIQFVAESTFKLLLAVPILGGALLVVLLLGGDLMELLSGDLRQSVAVISSALLEQPLALAAFLVSFAIVLLGGSSLMFLIKGGTVTVLVEGERTAGAIERPPLRMVTLRRAAKFSVDAFLGGAEELFRRYLRLGLFLIAVYGVSAVVYLFIVVNGYRLFGDEELFGWTVVAAIVSSTLILWITFTNLLYLLLQMVIAADRVGVRTAARLVAKFLRGRWREVALVFGILLLFVILATAGSVLATAGLGLISFVPFAGLAAFPLQLLAWLLRGLVFQYLGLTSLCTYLTLYREHVRDRSPETVQRAEPTRGPLAQLS